MCAMRSVTVVCWCADASLEMIASGQVTALRNAIELVGQHWMALLPAVQLS